MLAYLFKKFVVDRVIAKINIKQNDKDYSWIMDYPVSQNFIDNNYMLSSTIINLANNCGFKSNRTKRKPNYLYFNFST